MHQLFIYLLVWALAYLLAITLSGIVVKLLFGFARIESSASNDRAGRVIGKIEDVLVVTFVAAGAYTALALIFAAKSIARVDHGDQEKASYYILGTLGNFTWALLVALLAKLTLHFAGISLPVHALNQIS